MAEDEETFDIANMSGEALGALISDTSAKTLPIFSVDQPTFSAIKYAPEVTLPVFAPFSAVAPDEATLLADGQAFAKAFQAAVDKRLGLDTSGVIEADLVSLDLERRQLDETRLGDDEVFVERPLPASVDTKPLVVARGPQGPNPD